MNTAASETVIDTTVKPISEAPSIAACLVGFPISMCRTMFSSTTIASSTTNPTASVSAISDRLSRLNPRNCMTAKVPTIDSGRARLGMSVEERFRRNTKMTSTTSTRVSTSVNCTS